MSGKYKNIQWVVQRNLTNRSDFEHINDTCNKIGVPFIAVDIIPFTAALPKFEFERNTVIYGSTTFVGLAFEHEQLSKGVFFNAEKFSIENYIAKWGSHMLNHDASVSTFKELFNSSNYLPHTLLFIRPNDDSKSFAGEVRRFDEITDWYQNLIAVDNTNLSSESKIVVSKPYNIKSEWRLWIVNKKVVAASKYREYFKLKKEQGCPPEVTAFAEERCRQFAPHDVFVMDICLCGDEYFIVECGCMNAAGFYNADIEQIVTNVSDYFVSME